MVARAVGAPTKGATVAITINSSERDAIYQEVLTDLTGVGDIDIALRNEDYDAARRYRRRFEDDMRLLDDLGWEPEQDRDEFELTMPPDGLARVLERLNESAGATLHDHIVEPNEQREIAERALRAQTAYGSVLAQLAWPPDGESPSLQPAG